MKILTNRQTGFLFENIFSSLQVFPFSSTARDCTGRAPTGTTTFILCITIKGGYSRLRFGYPSASVIGSVGDRSASNRIRRRAPRLGAASHLHPVLRPRDLCLRGGISGVCHCVESLRRRRAFGYKTLHRSRHSNLARDSRSPGQQDSTTPLNLTTSGDRPPMYS